MKLPDTPDTTPTYLFNPAKEDFTTFYDGKEYILPSRVIVTHPKFLADHLAKHLAQYLAVKESAGAQEYQQQYQAYLAKIYVEL